MFTARRTVGSILIRSFTWSSWSHVAFVTPQYEVIESVSSEGVRRVSMEKALEGVHRYAYVAFNNGDSNAMEASLMTQIGKKYDYLGALGIGLHKDWGEMERWSCGELIAWAAEDSNQPIFRVDQTKKITPEDFWRIHPAGQTLILRK